MKDFLYIIAILTMSTATALACETGRKAHFDNSNVKVWTSTICKNDDLPFHTHQHPRILIPREDGELEVVYQDGTKSKIELKKDTPQYLDTKQGLSPHKEVNKSEKPVVVTVIELKTAM